MKNIIYSSFLAPFPKDEDDGEAETGQIEEKVKQISVSRSTLHLMGRKNLSTAFYTYEIYSEMEERNEIEEVIFGPKESPNDTKQTISCKESMEEYMRRVDSENRNRLYRHDSSDCSSACEKRGCGKLAVADGNWKVSYKVRIILFYVCMLMPCNCPLT